MSGGQESSSATFRTGTEEEEEETRLRLESQREVEDCRCGSSGTEKTTCRK